MARNRVIYQSEALYVSKNINSTGTGEHFQLRRVQSANYNFSIDRQDVNQFGQLARIDALVLKSPTVSLDFSYYPTDGINERALGFYVRTGTQSEGNFASGQMGASSGQNFYIVTADEGQDVNTLTGASVLSGKNVIAIGNGFLSNYTFDASVGNLPTAKVTIEGLNIQTSPVTSNVISGGANVFNLSTTAILTGNIVASPTIDPIGGTGLGKSGVLPSPFEATGVGGTGIVSALRPGDIVFDYGTFTGTGATPISDLTSLNVQSASLSLPLSRTPIERLGSRFAYARVVDFPIVASLNVSAIVTDAQARNLADMLNDNSKRTVTITIKNPTTSVPALVFTMKGAQMASESFSSSIGANKTVDLVFNTQIGGPTDVSNGIYASGAMLVGDAQTNVNGTWGY